MHFSLVLGIGFSLRCSAGAQPTRDSTEGNVGKSWDLGQFDRRSSVTRMPIRGAIRRSRMSRAAAQVRVRPILDYHLHTLLEGIGWALARKLVGAGRG
jgi:hypothetical protein